MATVEVPTKVCDRCQFGKGLPPTEERKWSIGEDHYINDLCVKHAAQWDREFGAWACMARPDESRTRAPVYFTSAAKEADRRAAELRARQSAVTIRKVEPTAPADDEPTPITPRTKAEALAAGWILSTHAEERAQLREFTKEEMLLAAADPQRTQPNRKYGERARIHVRGDCAVAVDPISKIVFTVMPRGSYTFTADRERIAQ